MYELKCTYDSNGKKLIFSSWTTTNIIEHTNDIENKQELLLGHFKDKVSESIDTY